MTESAQHEAEKDQQEMYMQDIGIPTEPCRVCTDINDWAIKAQKMAFKKKDSKTRISNAKDIESENYYDECPPDSQILGHHTWTFLHTMAAYYPETPNEEEQSEMRSFFRTFSKFYPCHYCAKHLQGELVKSPPRVESRWMLSLWLCSIHNEVNDRLGKKRFDCSRVLERWRNGPKDGSCDSSNH